jgi:hypothetical protein
MKNSAMLAVLSGRAGMMVHGGAACNGGKAPDYAKGGLCQELAVGEKGGLR